MQEIKKTIIEILKEINPKAKYGALVDYRIAASNHRFFLIDLKEEKVIYSWYTSHGSGSGGKDKATSFSNENNSHKSCLGRMITLEPYFSNKFGYALRLRGLDATNNKAEARAIVIHKADYVAYDYILQNVYPGRSWGCITLDPAEHKDIINKLKGGSPILAIA